MIRKTEDKGFEGGMAWKAHRDSDGKREVVEFRWKVPIQMRGPNLFRVESEGSESCFRDDEPDGQRSDFRDGFQR